MMTLKNRIRLSAIIVVIVFGSILLFSSMYTVNEWEQVVVTQFHKPVGKPVTEAGLHFKTPFIQDVNSFEKRILEWDGDPNLIPTRDKTFIYVDVTARWRIVDALVFFTSVVTETGAQARLDDILDGATRVAVSKYDLIESIRLTNRKLPRDFSSVEESQLSKTAEIKVGRGEIQKQIKQAAAGKLTDFGIELVDVRIKHLKYSDKVGQKVEDRMISERRRIAEKFRSEGQGKKAEIDGQREKELKKISSGAYKTAQEIQGAADAQVTTIYAEAYGQDAEFYTFLRSLEVLKESLIKGTEYIGSTDNDLFKYLKGLDPVVKPAKK